MWIRSFRLQPLIALSLLSFFSYALCEMLFIYLNVNLLNF